MIVCSLPRCGATRYCIDLSGKVNLPFVGEYKPLHIRGFENREISRKEQYHETKYQPLFDPEQFVDIISNPSSYIIMINEFSHLMLPQADIIMLRRNMKNAFYSLANLNLKTYPEMKINVTLGAFYHQMLESLYAIVLYLEKHTKPVIWYEDYFHNKPVNTEILDKYVHRDIVYKYVDTLFKQNDIELRLKNLEDRTR